MKVSTPWKMTRQGYILTRPKIINLRGSGASCSMCCTVLSTALQDKVEGRRVTVWTGAAMMMGGVENSRENRENYFFSVRRFKKKLCKYL